MYLMGKTACWLREYQRISGSDREVEHLIELELPSGQRVRVTTVEVVTETPLVEDRPLLSRLTSALKYVVTGRP